MSQTHEKYQSLWLLTASPTIWAAHFLLSYVTAAVWCAKAASPGSSVVVVRVALIIYTVLALVAIGIVGWKGYSKHSHGDAELPHDADTPEDRHRFIGFATLLLSSLSAIAVLFAALVPFFIGTCH